jgi:hypothetical protein
MALQHRTKWILWGISYVALLAAVAGTMFWLRQSVLGQFGTPESIADWQSWRADVQREKENPGPVERRVPKSTEPPALVLMRDYFGVSLAGATFFTSLLYVVISWFVVGALQAVSKPSMGGRSSC